MGAYGSPERLDHVGHRSSLERGDGFRRISYTPTVNDVSDSILEATLSDSKSLKVRRIISRICLVAAGFLVSCVLVADGDLAAILAILPLIAAIFISAFVKKIQAWWLRKHAVKIANSNETQKALSLRTITIDDVSLSVKSDGAHTVRPITTITNIALSEKRVLFSFLDGSQFAIYRHAFSAEAELMEFLYWVKKRAVQAVCVGF